jgi:cobalt-zinc-cadmium efflux system membrane fusion protein
MMFAKNLTVLSAMLMVGASVGLVGCNKASENAVPATQASDEHSHEGWWCNEHGVPEEVCALCSTNIAADFKAKGDWCKEHDRPESQCFICHPEKEAEFAALYEAKYGKQPPKPIVEDAEHEREHGDANG